MASHRLCKSFGHAFAKCGADGRLGVCPKEGHAVAAALGKDVAPSAGAFANEARGGAVPDVDAGLEVGVGASVRHRAEVEGGRAVYARPLTMVAEMVEELDVKIVGKGLILPVLTRASAGSAVSETWIGSPLQRAGPSIVAS